MSNHTDQQKVISIKKLNDIQQRPISQNTDMKNRQAGLKQEIAQLEQELDDLKSKKKTMLSQMKTAIEKEKEAWQEKKEKEKQEAKEFGYKVGYDEGIDHAEREWSERLKEANQISDSAKEDYYRTIAKHEDAIIQLAIQSAEKIIQDTLLEDESYFIGIIEQAIEQLKNRTNLTITVHPANYQQVIEQKEELEQLLEEGQLLSVFADKQLKEGACIINHPFGQIEAGIDVQLQQIKDALAEKLTAES